MVGLAEKGPDKAAPGEGEAEVKKAKDGGRDTTPESPWPELWKSVGEKFVTLVVSAGGLIGFVAFAGSVVLWSRFFAIHVPPDQVVAAVPQGESVAVGSVMLLLFGFFGALATITVYLIDRGGRATPGMSRALLVILTIEAAAAIWIAGDSSVQAKVIASEILALVFGLVLWSTFVGGLIELKPDELRDLKEGIEERGQDPQETAFWRPGNKPAVELPVVLGAVGLAIAIAGITFGVTRLFGAAVNWAWIVALGVGGVLLLVAIAIRLWTFDRRKKREKEEEDERKAAEKKREKEEAEKLTGRLKAAWNACRWSKCGRCDCRPCACHSKCGAGGPKAEVEEASEKPPLFELTIWGAAVVTALALVAVVAPSLILGEWWLGISLGVVFVIGSGLWRIAGLRREKFIWLGLAVFISVPLFGALMLMARNLAEPQVQAVAMIRSTDGPDEAIQGLYVTETSDRVYFANVATEGCSDEVKQAGGRLLWVPKEEVVAMSIGPLEDVEDAGKTALEMAYALTPAVETPAGDRVSLTPSEERSQEAKKAGAAVATPARKTEGSGSAAAPTAGSKSKEPGKTPAEKKVTLAALPEGRLEDPGPAVRPNFGAGMRLDPETASPGKDVTLVMSAPNTGVEGFGRSRGGRNLRLGGVIVDIAKERAVSADNSEYIEVGPAPGGAEERLLNLGKEGAYVTEDRKLVPVEKADDPAGKVRYVRLEDKALREVNGKPIAEVEPVYIKIDEPASASGGQAKVGDEAQSVTLAAGTFEGKSQGRETIDLSGLSLYRQAWHENHIKFRVPENAKSGVITVECGQLAGSPLLRVSHTPTARIAVRMRAGSQEVTLNSLRSGDEDGEKISRRWTIEGVHRGHRPTITTPLPLRPGAYTVKLTVTDEAGNVDTATLRLLRLPDSMFEFGKSRPDKQSRKAINAARQSLANAVAAGPPVAIELDGHADNPGATLFNLELSLKRADEVRSDLMPEPKEKSKAKEALEAVPSMPVEELAYGETCPIDPRSGERPLNRRVEIFILDEGVTVKPPSDCIPGRLKHMSWQPQPPAGEKASSSSTASASP